MPNAKLNQQLTKVARALEDIRETLFESSRESVKAEDDHWHKAEAIFSLAKSVDGIRRQTLALMNGARPAAASETAAIRPASTKGDKKNKKDYPRYEVRGRSLIKTGLSRDKRTEYEHVMPRDEFEKVFAKIATLASSRKEFTADDVQKGLTCPMYQTYMVLALLRQMDLLDAPRRGGYESSPNGGFPTAADEVWHKIGHR